MRKGSETLETVLSGHVLKIALNRPAQLNALNREMQQALEDTFMAANADSNVRVIVITGTGRGFCSGADIAGLQESARERPDPQTFKVPKFTNRQCGIFKPTICAVNGVCAGAGLHFVADCDIVIAASNANFVDTHVNVGQVTALEPIGLMRRVSLSAVLRLAILGKAERLTAEQALTLGMVSEVWPAEQLLGRALDLAATVASVSPTAVQRSLEAIRASLEMPLANAYKNGFEILVRHRSHPDALVGPKAFAEKRSPNWVG
jgi:enoyl-CoA hydratase/carnithine racemase